MSKLHIKKGDQVQVIAGDSKGQTGKVLKVEVSKQRAIVEGVNLCKAPIHISNLMLIDPKSGKPTKVGRKTDAKGKLVRFAKKSGEEIK